MSRVLCMLLVLLATPLACLGGEPKPPNFLFLFVDDQAWSGTSVPMIQGDPASRTAAFHMPNLECIAAEGMVFSQAYASHPKCECSRAALLMGRSTTSLNAVDKRARTWSAPARAAIANTLKESNPAYRAAHFGKWQWPQTPASMGFDASDGITQNEDGNSTDPMDPKQSFGITRRAEAYMEKQVAEGHPFYLQLAFYAVHAEPQALEATLKKYQGLAPTRAKGAKGDTALAAAMAEDLDTCIGTLLKKLADLGIEENTFVIYMADNGMRSAMLKGGKTVLDEGGIRVPLIVRGPGVRKGAYCNTPVVGYDLLPTVLDLASPGFALPKGVEGGSWKPLLLGTEGAKAERPIDRIVWHNDTEVEHPQTAMRKGDLKLLHYWDTREDFLYDLSADIGERNNLAASRPTVVAEMLAELKAHVRAGLGEEKFLELESGKIKDSERPAGPRGKQKKNQK